MDDIRPNLPTKPSRFMDQIRVFIRSKHMAYKTEKTYCTWIIDFIHFHEKKHPKDMRGKQIELGDRRLDVIEYLQYCEAQEVYPTKSLKSITLGGCALSIKLDWFSSFGTAR